MWSPDPRRQMWAPDPRVPPPGWWWDRKAWRQVNPSATYPAPAVSMHDVIGRLAMVLMLAGLPVMFVSGYAAKALWRPLVLGVPLGFAAMAVSGYILWSRSRVRRQWRVGDWSEALDVRNSLSARYAQGAPAGWAAVPANTVRQLRDDVEALMDPGGLGRQWMVTSYADPVWARGAAHVWGYVARVSLRRSTYHCPGHFAAAELPGRFALPALRVTPETPLTKLLATATGADRDTVLAEFNRNFTVSVSARDHPLLEPHLVELLNTARPHNYIYHFEGNLVIVWSQSDTCDPALLGEHLAAVTAAVPAYLYE